MSDSQTNGSAADDAGKTPLRAVIERSLTGSLDIKRSWGVALFGDRRPDNDATNLANDYEALHKQVLSLQRKIVGAPPNFDVPKPFTTDLDGVVTWMEDTEKQTIGHTPPDRAKVSGMVKDHTKTLAELDEQLTEWLEDRAEQDGFRARAKKMIEPYDSLVPPEGAEPEEIEAISCAYFAVADALDLPRLTEAELTEGERRIGDLQRTLEVSGSEGRRNTAKQVRETVAALRAPAGATDQHKQELKMWSDLAAFTVEKDVPSSAWCQAGLAQLENLGKVWTRIKTEADQQRAADELLKKQAETHAQSLNTQLGDAFDRERDVAARTERALAGWRQAFQADEQAVDADMEKAVEEALARCTAAAADWRAGISEQHDAVADALVAGSADQMAEAGRQAEAVGRTGNEALREAEQALNTLLDTLDTAVRELAAEVKARLSAADETILTNAFARGRPDGEKARTNLARGLGDRIKDVEAKLPNILEFLEGLAGQGATLEPEKVSRQKPTEVVKGYLLKADPTLEAVFNDALREHAAALQPLGSSKVVELARALVATGGTRDDKRWLVKMVLKGASLDTLPDLFAARGMLQSAPLDTQSMTKLNAKWADPAFATILNDLYTRKVSPALFGAGLKAYLNTDDPAVAVNVCEDYYGLLGASPPWALENRIGAGVSAGVIVLKQEKTTGGGSGHKYKFNYIGGSPASLFELHVHQKPGTNWYPAWKYVSNPYGYVDSALRASHTIHGALKTHL